MDKSLLNGMKKIHENCLMYQIELKTSDLIQLLDQIRGYNSFDPIELKKFVQKVDKKFQELYKDEIFNIRFIFGREYSPVLYIKINTEKENIKPLINSIQQLKKNLNCDEFNINENEFSDTEIRIWFD
jgi:hypothetical protein